MPSQFAELPVLNDIRIASPCSANWEEMVGDERKRFCSHCKLHVYNLSAMSAAEAERLVAQSPGRLCVRLFRRADGTVLTQDCPVGLRAIRQRILRTLAISLTTVVSLAASVSFAITRWKPSGRDENAQPAQVLPTTYTSDAIQGEAQIIPHNSLEPAYPAMMGKVVVPSRPLNGSFEMGGCPAPPR